MQVRWILLSVISARMHHVVQWSVFGSLSCLRPGQGEEEEKAMIEIKNRRTGEIIYSSGCETLREAVIEYLKKSGADLSGADLSRADLSGADLFVANLSWADLSGADLSRANLSRADLSVANLSCADLSGADLSGANLSWADLSEADLSWANLSRADLSGAKGGAVCRMDFGGWSICVREDKTTIGCQCQENSSWLKWTPKSKEICAMYENAGVWWAMHGPAVKAAIRVVMKKARENK